MPRYVVQEVVPDGIDHEGRRIDLRVHGMLTSVEPLTFSYYPDGVVRVAPLPEDPQRPDELPRVLTGFEYTLRMRLAPTVFPLSALVAELCAAGFAVDDLEQRIERLLGDVLRCLFQHHPQGYPADLGRSFLFFGADMILVVKDGAVELRFLELNDVPGGLFFSVPELAAALLPTQRRMVADLRALAERAHTAGPRAPDDTGRPARR